LPTKRRTRVPGEQNRSIYFRLDAAGKKVYEVGYRSATGSQSFKTVGPKVTEARTERDRLLGSRVKIANVRLTFGKAADAWLEQQVVNLADRTQDYYRERLAHIRPVWGRRRMDQITTADAARLVADLRAAGMSESTINGTLLTAGRVYRFAKGRLSWSGDNPIELLDSSDRARLTETPPRRIFARPELDATIAATREPWRTIFILTATTGARQSEIAALVWDDLDIANVDEASIRFEFQLDRKTGKRVRLKTPESRRTIELPQFVAVLLAELKARSQYSRPDQFVFATRTGEAIRQRNLSRELRAAQTRAVDAKGRPIFPLLHVKDDDGNRVNPPRNSIPSWHSLRHSAASEAIHDGESIEDVADRLGHKNTIITETIYRHEIKSAKRSAERRARLDTRYGGWQQLAAADLSLDQPASATDGAEVVDLQAKRGRRQ
jgi:integrase